MGGSQGSSGGGSGGASSTHCTSNAISHDCYRTGYVHGQAGLHGVPGVCKANEVAKNCYFEGERQGVTDKNNENHQKNNGNCNRNGGDAFTSHEGHKRT
jgi:hypothetical protein